MTFALCLLAFEAPGISDALRGHYESLPRTFGLIPEWRVFANAAVLTDRGADPQDAVWASEGDHLAFGMVRLDNRKEIAPRSEYPSTGLPDLSLVLSAVVREGPDYIPHLIGDFAFVIWNTRLRTAVAACDPFMLKRLFYVERAGLLAFSSRAEALSTRDGYDVQYLAESVALFTPSPALTVYAGVRSLPPATIIRFDGARQTSRQYWSPEDFEPDHSWAKRESEAVANCRQLLADSVRLRLTGGGETWAQLSGGMDSSSIVSVAQWLATRGIIADGLGGSISYAYGHGTGADEREYSDAVAARWAIRNEVIVAPPIWHDHSYPPPQMDQPRVGFVHYPRDRRVCEIIRGWGGRVLLTGVGGDDLFTGNMFFLADWVAGGRIRLAVREAARRAALGRVSFWELGYRHALLPLLPVNLQPWLAGAEAQVPPWVSSSVVREYRLRERRALMLAFGGRLGHKSQHAVVQGLKAIGPSMDYEIIQESLEVRHPFLYRPLVEFGLRLPPELCARPHQRKWVLREAVRGIVPEVVRTRVGKGGPDGVYAWSLIAQRELLEPLTREPILADLGVIDPSRLRTALETVPHQPARAHSPHSALQVTLAVEAWLEMRAGRWPHGAAPEPLGVDGYRE